MLAIVIPYYKYTFFEETLISLSNQTDKRFKIYIGDYFLYMLVARYGKIKKLADNMAVYRVHSGGVHSLTSQKNKDIQWLTLQNLIIPVFTDDVRKELLDNFIQNGKRCLQYDNELSIQTQIQNNLLALHPDLIVDLIKENEKLKSQLNSGQAAFEILKLKFKNRLIQLMPGLTSKKKSVKNL